MLSIFSCVCYPSVCLLWRNVCLGLFPLFDWVVCFSGLELYELPMYFRNESFVSCFICYYFLPSWGLSFHLSYSFLCSAKVFKFNQVPLVYFCFYFHYSRRWVIEDLALCHRFIDVIIWCHLIYVIGIYVLPMFSSESFTIFSLTFRPLIHLSLSLYMVLGSFLISFFYM